MEFNESIKNINNEIKSINEYISTKYIINYKDIYKTLLECLYDNNILSKNNDDYIYDFEKDIINYGIKKIIDSVLDYIKNSNKLDKTNEIIELLNTIKDFTFLVFPYGRTSNYYKYQQEDFSSETITRSIKKAFENRKSIIKQILKIYFLIDSHNALSFYKSYKNIYDLKSSDLFLSIFKDTINKFSITDCKYVIEELSLDESYFSEFEIKNLKCVINELQNECNNFFKYDLDYYKDISSHYTINLFESIKFLIDFAKTNFNDCDDSEYIQKLNQFTIDKHIYDNPLLDENQYFIEIFRNIADISYILLITGLINNKILELIYIIYKDFARLLDNSDVKRSDAINTFLDFLIKKVNTKNDNLSNEAKEKLFDSFCENARNYLKENKIQYYFSKDKTKWFLPDDEKDEIYKITSTNEQLGNELRKEARDIFNVICYSQDFKNKESTYNSGDFSIFFTIPIKMVERYLKTMLVKKHRNNIQKITKNCTNRSQITFEDKDIDKDIDSLSHSSDNQNNVLDLGGVALAIQYALNFDENGNELFNRKKTIFTGFYCENNTKKIELYKNDNRELQLKYSTYTMPFQEFISFIRNGYMHTDICINFEKAEEIYNATCYWLIKCIDL